MMGTRTRHPWLSWIVLAAYGVGALAFGNGVVLCREPDGRTVVELAGGHGQCAEGLVAAHDDPGGVHDGHAECHDGGCARCPCEDTTLSVTPAPAEKKSWAALTPPAAALLYGPGAERSAASPRGEPAVADWVTLKSLRSVVLLV